jgi:hypothetical protein
MVRGVASDDELDREAGLICEVRDQLGRVVLPAGLAGNADLVSPRSSW